MLAAPFSLSWRVPDGLAPGLPPGTELIRVGAGATAPVEVRLVAEPEPTVQVLTRWTFREEPLRLSVPLAWVAGSARRRVTLLRLPERLELHVDGVVVDEEWPAGELLSPGDEPAAVHPAIGTIEWGSGDAPAGRRPPAGDAGNRARLYWRPPGHNVTMGDCMPFADGDLYRLFYLADRRNHRSMWGFGGHQWAQMSTRDFVTWVDHGLAVPITDAGEGSICTGSVIRVGEEYQAFYTVRQIDRSPAPLRRSVSRDGETFRKDPAPLLVLSERYTAVSARDPFVFLGDDGAWHMYVTTSLTQDATGGRAGCLAHLTSSNLTTWEEHEPVLVPGYPDEPECSERFRWNGWDYLIFSNGGVARYLVSEAGSERWRRPRYDGFDGALLGVMRSAPFGSGRRIGAGFLRDGGYGGDLVLREIVQEPDGGLATRFLPEHEALFESELPITLGTPDERAPDGPRGIATLAAPTGYDELRVELPTQRLLISVVLSLPDDVASCGVAIGDSGDAGVRLVVRPAERRIAWEYRDGKRFRELACLEGVVELDESRVELQLIVAGRVIDACLNGRRTLIARSPEGFAIDSMAVFVHFGEVTIESADVRVVSALSPDVGPPAPARR